MASTADKVLQNFKWRIETITLAHVRPGRNKLRWLGKRVDPDVSTGTERAFNVFWAGQTEPDEENVRDINERIDRHRFRVEVYYPADAIELLELQIMILKDRHDIYKQLRNMDNRLGYNASNTSENIGLWAREIDEDWELDDESDITWILRSTWYSDIRESE